MRIEKIIRKEEANNICFLEVTFSKYVLFKGRVTVVRAVSCGKYGDYYYMPKYCKSGWSLPINLYSLVQEFAESGIKEKTF